MSASTLFAVPGMSQASATSSDSTKKRKRLVQEKHIGERSLDRISADESLGEQIAEYTAVVTPAERTQRRLAGLGLTKHIPGRPFPHKDVADSEEGDYHNGRVASRTTKGRPSLHAQHMSAVTAILHRCMMSHDYERASRAIGLLLRSDIAGNLLDIRSENLWAMAAEVLLRQSANNVLPRTENVGPMPVTSREGFERAKLYYETLIVLFPQHKSWTAATNARDFCIAMFGLWIYVTQQEADQLHARDSVDQENPGDQLSTLQVKVWELERARKIAEDLSDRMRDAILKDDLELLRLQGLIALWIADLAESCADLEDVERQRREFEEEYAELQDDLNNVERIYLPPIKATKSPTSRMQEVDEARAFAKDIMAKLERNMHHKI